MYTELDLQRLLFLQQLQAGGLSLSECKACLDSKFDKSLLSQRLSQLDEDIAKKMRARTLLAALLGQGSLREWHTTASQIAPDAHLAWLKQQGFDEKQALHLTWLSKDMHEHERYMQDFMTVFSQLERWGPSSDSDTLKALSYIPTACEHVIDIGCGKGFSTAILAKHTQAQIVAVDNEKSALDSLKQRLVQQQLDAKVTLLCASMTELPFDDASFDLIWSECAAYIMGVEHALTQWQRLLTADGYLVLSDLVWLTHSPSPDARAFWQDEYPDMQTVATRIKQIQRTGYELVEHFTVSQQAWADYYVPLKARVAQLESNMANSAALTDIKREIRMYEEYAGEFGYEMFVMKKP